MKSSSKTNQFFRAIMSLSRGRYYLPKELAEELDIELRTIYRYIDDLEESPFFELNRRGRRIRLSGRSLFWANVTNYLSMSEKEALALHEVLKGLKTTDKNLENLRRKLKNLADNELMPQEGDEEVKMVGNVAEISKAITTKHMCMLRGYTSLHSDTKTDRLVEPFCFLDGKNDVRCYELKSGINKTFKLSRCESVEVLDVDWQFEKKHKQMFTDLFNFSDEKKTRVRLLLGNLSKTILLEEHPDAVQHLIPSADGRWLFDAEFCSMKGVGRFFLGLFEDIEIVDSPEFKAYIQERINVLTVQK